MSAHIGDRYIAVVIPFGMDMPTAKTRHELVDILAEETGYFSTRHWTCHAATPAGKHHSAHWLKEKVFRLAMKGERWRLSWQEAA